LVILNVFVGLALELVLESFLGLSLAANRCSYDRCGGCRKMLFFLRLGQSIKPRVNDRTTHPITKY